MDWMEFREQIWPIKDRLYRLALRLVNDRAEAEDVVQEVMVKLWQQGKDLLLIKNMEAWCLRMTRNQALDKLKGGYRKRRTEITDNLPQFTIANGPDQQLEWKDTYQQIRTIIQNLPENHRSVVQLRDIEGMSYQEIADALEMTMPQVKTNLFRARKALREALLKQSSYGL
ncbi:RNA polymerase sigma factor [Lewinella cohaerens]|uniref:RNA polymerase sigma factor n=1 Tax=Lewinella cohaerens TaxID=70995 RepID=UPI0003632C8F|nr:RNA polymerase sigma factor [Lewinella cohaerens]